MNKSYGSKIDIDREVKFAEKRITFNFFIIGMNAMCFSYSYNEENFYSCRNRKLNEDKNGFYFKFKGIKVYL